MAIQFPNFVGHGEKPTDYSNIGNLLENALKGYQIGQAPASMERQAEKERLANSLAQLTLQHKPREFSLADALKEEQIKAARSGGKLKPTGDIGNQLYIDQLSQTNPDLAKKLQEIQDVTVGQKRQRTDSAKAYSNSIAFRALPAAEKQRTLSYAVGMGYDPSEASSHLSSGKTLEDLAADKGVTLSEVQPNFPLSGAEIKDTRKRNAFNEEMKTLDKRVTEGMAPYAKKVKGMSFEQIIDSLDELKEPGKEKQEKLGKFLAARALAPELAALRLNAMGGRVGIEGIKHLNEVSAGTAKALEGLLDEPTYRAFQDYMTKYIDEAINSYTSVINKTSQLGTPQQTQEAPRKVYDLSTRSWQ